MVAEVLVVGAGPVGLTLGIELARRGIRCRVIDRAEGPAPHSRALVIHRRTLELLERAGLRQRITERSIPLAGMMFTRAYRDISRIPFGQGAETAVSLPQQATEAVLRDALAAHGVNVEWGAELTGLEAGAGSVKATLGADSVEAAYVVGCDGAHSSVRHLAGIAFEGDSLPETVLMADAALDWDVAPDHTRQFLHPDGPISVIPMPGGVWRLAAVPAEGNGDPTPEFFEAALRRRSGRPLRRIGVTWTSTFKVNCRLAARYRSQRVLLAGDAAHIHSPVGGQGMNVGMQDSFNLGWKLAATLRGWGPQLLDTYELERRPVAAAVIAANARMVKLLMSRNPVQGLLRDRVLPQALRLPPVSRRAGLEASGLGISYAQSPISGPGGGGRHAGVSTDGPDSWSVAAESSTSCLVVRPDGYVAARVPAGEGAVERFWAESMGRLGAPAEPAPALG